MSGSNFTSTGSGSGSGLLGSDWDYEWMNAVLATVEVFAAIYSLILFSVSVVCNPLSLIVLSRKAFAKSNISVFLRCLTVSDTIAVILIGVRYSTKTLYGMNILANDIMCGVYFYGINAALYSSSWILVVVTLERVIAVVKPHSVQTICSRNKAKLTTAMIITLWLGCMWFFPYLHRDYTIRYGNFSYTYQCIMVVNSKMAVNAVTYFDNLLFAFIPSCLLITFSIIIVIGLRKSRKSMEAKEEKKTAAAEGEGGKSAKVIARASRDAAMTRTVLCVNLCFVLCNFPYCIFVFIPTAPIQIGSEASYFVQRIFTTILILLVYTNNTLNFAMYLATGSKFREELKAFFREIGLVKNTAKK